MAGDLRQSSAKGDETKPRARQRQTLAINAFVNVRELQHLPKI